MVKDDRKIGRKRAKRVRATLLSALAPAGMLTLSGAAAGLGHSQLDPPNVRAGTRA